MLGESCSSKLSTDHAGTDDFQHLSMAADDSETGCAHCSVSYLSTLMMRFLMLVPDD